MYRWLNILFLILTPLVSWAEPVKELPWSFTSLDELPLPKTQKTSWAHNRVDHFVLSRMESKGLQPAPAAGDRVLLRRLYFDLIGFNIRILKPNDILKPNISTPQKMRKVYSIS